MTPDYCPRISQRLQIAVPESFMNGQGEGRGEAVHLYNNVDQNWFMKTFAKAKLQLCWLAKSALISTKYPFDYSFKTDNLKLFPVRY